MFVYHSLEGGERELALHNYQVAVVGLIDYEILKILTFHLSHIDAHRIFFVFGFENQLASGKSALHIGLEILSELRRAVVHRKNDHSFEVIHCFGRHFVISLHTRLCNSEKETVNLEIVNLLHFFVFLDDLFEGKSFNRLDISGIFPVPLFHTGSGSSICLCRSAQCRNRNQHRCCNNCINLFHISVNF